MKMNQYENRARGFSVSITLNEYLPLSERFKQTGFILSKVNTGMFISDVSLSETHHYSTKKKAL